jgi:hypothetical protein
MALRSSLRLYSRQGAAAASSAAAAARVLPSILRSRYLSTVLVEKYSSSLSSVVSSSSPSPSSLSSSPYRLPNDVRVRNSLYDNEESRSMAGITASVRTNWSKDEISDIYNLPFYELMYQAATVHRMFWNPSEVQQCTLLSIKTGGCTEDCSYCSQSTRHKTHVKPTPTMKVQEVLDAARIAKEAGSTRFCMGAAWRELGRKMPFSTFWKWSEVSMEWD